MQKSHSFIFPMMNFNNQKLHNNIVTTYLGHVEYEGLDSWGNYFYIEYNPLELNEGALKELRKHPQYITELDTEEGTLIFVYKLTRFQKSEIIKPFLEGKYSEINRDYVKAHFTREVNGNYSMNWRILHKDAVSLPAHVEPKSLRDYWQSRIGIPLPPNAEVWSKPEKADEIWGYTHYTLCSKPDTNLAMNSIA